MRRLNYCSQKQIGTNLSNNRTNTYTSAGIAQILSIMKAPEIVAQESPSGKRSGNIGFLGSVFHILRIPICTSSPNFSVEDRTRRFGQSFLILRTQFPGQTQIIEHDGLSRCSYRTGHKLSEHITFIHTKASCFSFAIY